ncbi:hypothetical protein UlMin_033218 [Ulmus minor]
MCRKFSTFTHTLLQYMWSTPNHLGKLFVTNNAATIVSELEVQHAAAKIFVLGGKAQQEEIGDGANLTISFAGELLQNTEELIGMGLHPSEIISGYNKAITKTTEVLDELVEKGSEKMDVRNKDEVISRMKAAVASKQFGQEDILSSHIADACIQVCPKNLANLNVMCVLQKLSEGVVIFAGGVDTSATETKGTVLIHSAEQLENYTKTEEAKVEELIKVVADSGAKVIVSRAIVGEMALHFCEQMMLLGLSSEWRRLRFAFIVVVTFINPTELGCYILICYKEFGRPTYDQLVEDLNKCKSRFEELEGDVDMMRQKNHTRIYRDSALMPTSPSPSLTLEESLNRLTSLRFKIKLVKPFEIFTKLLKNKMDALKYDPRPKFTAKIPLITTKPSITCTKASS